MTSTIPGERARRLAGRRRTSGIDACLAALAAATESARGLGLDVTAAEATAREADERLGLGADAYVLALVGGTGVGKSSLLNALAGSAVSAASARRPTTALPVAWVAAGAAVALGPVLDRLGVAQRRLHEADELDGVVILDLPDVDSLEASHRAAVEAVLPRVDAVAWVTDPEKYADAILHDGFLRRWVPRLDRQLVVLNKADRLPPAAVDDVTAHLSRLLGTELAGSGSARPEVIAVSAVAGPAGVAPLRAWLNEALDAKAIVAGRLAAAAGASVADLARAGGAMGEAGRRPLVDAAGRRRAIDAATDEVLRVVDLSGAQRQAVAATRARARPRGTGPLGRVTAFVYRSSGRERRVANPGEYLRGWRGRGSLSRGAGPVREAVSDALVVTPPALRPRLAEATEPSVLEARLGAAVDRAIAAHPDLEAPTSRLWSLLGVLQTANLALLVFAVAWIVLWVLARPPVDTVDLPLVGRVAMPLALLVLGLAIGFVLARLLALHAGWIGRRWARRLADDIRTAVTTAVGDEAFAVVDRVEAARRALWVAARDAEAGCG